MKNFFSLCKIFNGLNINSVPLEKKSTGPGVSFAILRYNDACPLKNCATYKLRIMFYLVDKSEDLSLGYSISDNLRDCSKETRRGSQGE